MSTENSEKKSQLTMEKTIKLADWIRRQSLIDTTAERLALAAMADLGIRITANNIRASLSACGLEITSTPKPEAIPHWAAVLATAIADTRTDLDLPISDELRKLALGEG